MKTTCSLLLAIIPLFVCCCGAGDAYGTVMAYKGMCDASAVAALDDEFFVVADDEDDNLRVYSRLKDPTRKSFRAMVIELTGSALRGSHPDSVRRP